MTDMEIPSEPIGQTLVTDNEGRVWHHTDEGWCSNDRWGPIDTEDAQTWAELVEFGIGTVYRAEAAAALPHPQTDTEIPQAAVEAAAAAFAAGGWSASLFESNARAALLAALPHLQADTKAMCETATKAATLLALEEAAKIADGLARGVANPEKPYNEAFIHACGCVARAIRDRAKGVPS